MFVPLTTLKYNFIKDSRRDKIDIEYKSTEKSYTNIYI